MPKARRIKEYRNGYTGATCAVRPVFIVAKGSAKVPWAARERATRTASEPDETSRSLRCPSGSKVNRTKLAAVTTMHQCAKVHIGNRSKSKSWGTALTESDTRILCFKPNRLTDVEMLEKHAYLFSRASWSITEKEFARFSRAARPGNEDEKTTPRSRLAETRDSQKIPPSRSDMRVGEGSIIQLDWPAALAICLDHSSERRCISSGATSSTCVAMPH